MSNVEISLMIVRVFSLLIPGISLTLGHRGKKMDFAFILNILMITAYCNNHMTQRYFKCRPALHKHAEAALKKSIPVQK